MQTSAPAVTLELELELERAQAQVPAQLVWALALVLGRRRALALALVRTPKAAPMMITMTSHSFSSLLKTTRTHLVRRYHLRLMSRH